MSCKISVVLFLCLGVLLFSTATASYGNSEYVRNTVVPKSSEAPLNLGTCKCRTMQPASRSSRCYSFVDYGSRVCRIRRCQLSYVCDEARGNLICRWTISKTRIMKDGPNTCKVINETTKDLSPIRSTPIAPSKVLKFSVVGSSRVRLGSPKAVIDGPHYTQGFLSSKCLVTHETQTLSFWRGHFAVPTMVAKVVLTPRMDRFEKMQSIRVYAGSSLCTRATPLNRPTTRIVYNCDDTVATFIQVNRPKESLQLCGIDAYGEIYKPNPVPLPYDLHTMTMLTFSKATWTGSPASQAMTVTRLPHPRFGWNSDRCVLGRLNGDSWYGSLRRREKVSIIVLTAHVGSNNWKAMTYVKVQVGTRTCTRGTVITKDTWRVFFDCKGYEASTVRVTAHRNYKLELCGIDAHSPQPKISP